MTFELFSILFYSPQLSSSTKEAPQNASPGQKSEGKEDGDLKEGEKKETSDAPAASTEEAKAQEESKEEAKQASKQDEVKEEKSGEKKQQQGLDKLHLCDKIWHAQTHKIGDLFVFAEGEKAGEEKEEISATAEAGDAKEKAEATDVKKGTCHCLIAAVLVMSLLVLLPLSDTNASVFCLRRSLRCTSSEM